MRNARFLMRQFAAIAPLLEPEINNLVSLAQDLQPLQ